MGCLKNGASRGQRLEAIDGSSGTVINIHLQPTLNFETLPQHKGFGDTLIMDGIRYKMRWKDLIGSEGDNAMEFGLLHIGRIEVG